MDLIRHDLGFPLYQAIAAAKHALSRNQGATVTLDRDGVTLQEVITRSQFEAMVRDDIARIADTAVQTVAEAGRTPGDVDVCFMTGGCSLVPAVSARFGEIFPGKLSTEGDAFTSVASGLALYGLEAAGA